MLNDVDFEETVAAELRQTTSILHQIVSLNEDKHLTQAPDIQSDECYDYKLIKE